MKTINVLNDIIGKLEKERGCFYLSELYYCLWKLQTNKKKEDELAHLRMESMNNAWRPREARIAWFVEAQPGGHFCTYQSIFFKESNDSTSVFLGMWHPTKEKAEEWGKKYAKAFKL